MSFPPGPPPPPPGSGEPPPPIDPGAPPSQAPGYPQPAYPTPAYPTQGPYTGQPGQPYPGQYPAPYPGQPYAGQPYAGPPPKTHTVRTVLLIVFGVLVLVIGGCVALGFTVFNAVKGAPDETNRYLADLKADRYGAAYGRLCTSMRGQLALADFTQELQNADAHGRIDNYYVHGFATRNGDTTVDYELDRSGVTTEYETILVRENGRWKLCGFHQIATGTGSGSSDTGTG